MQLDEWKADQSTHGRKQKPSKTLGSRLYKVTWWVLQLTSIRAVWERLFPPKKDGRRPAASLVLWMIGIYSAVYGIAVTRYENAADRVELRANNVISLISNDKSRQAAIGQIAEVQQMRIPIEPVYGKPTTIWNSFFLGETQRYQFSQNLLKKAIITFKKDLSHTDLSWAELSGASLNGAHLHKTDLYKTSLAMADLSNANLSEANLSVADLNMAHLHKTDLYKTSLAMADLSNANLSEANLSVADLTGAHFIEADLSGADLSGADLNAASLMKADLTKADLSDTKLAMADLSGANLTNINLKGADLSIKSLNIKYSGLSGRSLAGANLTGADLSKADLAGADLTGVNLKDIKHWKTVTSWENTNIFNVRNAPAGLINHALERGAVRMPPDQWAKFSSTL